MHAVMKHWDPMVGVDFHMGYSPIVTPPPAPPVPTGPYPFATMQFTSGLYVFFKPLWKQATLYGVSVEKTTDIGSGIPHIPMAMVIVELPMIIAFSASKSHFGSSTYFVTDKTPALALAVFANPNLNCGLPCPTPTGVAICINTHVAGMSWGDIGSGFGSMCGDIVVQTILNVLGMKYGEGFGKWLAGKVGASATGFIANQAWQIASLIFGGPLGADIGTVGGIATDQKGEAWTPGGAIGTAFSSFGEGVGKAFGAILDGDTPQFPVPDIRYPVGLPKPKIPNVTDNPPPL